MSTTAESIPSENDDIETGGQLVKGNPNIVHDRYGSSILTSKENILKSKSKCNKTLKKKLKKYKLRKDGKDDPDVLDVSQCLSSALKIKSPVAVTNNNFNNDYVDKSTFNNYLMKMAKTNTQLHKVSDNIQTSDVINIQKTQNTFQKNSHMLDYDIGEDKCLTRFCSSKDDASLKEVSTGEPISKSEEMNAFQLMMNARNKSIGTNSPGKEKSVEPSQNDILKKDLKLKRNLALEKMAQAKGSLKNNEIEALKDKTIQMKMDKRAKRLQNMLTKNAKVARKTENGHLEHCVNTCYTNIALNQQTVKKRINSNINSEKLAKRFKTDSCVREFSKNCDDVIEVTQDNNQKNTKDFVVSGKQTEKYFETNKISNKSPSCKRVNESEDDFFSKLSPSLKKKESVLSYFVIKDNNTKEVIAKDTPLNDKIRVKFTAKGKHKNKKITNKHLEDLNKIRKPKECDTNNVKTSKKTEPKLKPKKKQHVMTKKCHRKELYNAGVIKVEDSDDEFLVKTEEKGEKVSKKIKNKICKQSLQSSSVERHSKRNTKKPAKYQDCIQSSTEESSGNESIIFSSKSSHCTKTLSANKKKLGKTASMLVLKDSTRKEADNSLAKKKAQNEKFTKKPKKYAPIFAQKSNLSQAELEAKQKFLESGIPDQLKKIIYTKKNIDLEMNYFTTVHHVQQMTTATKDFNPWVLKPVNFIFNAEESEYNLNFNDYGYPAVKLETFPSEDKRPRRVMDSKMTLELIKQTYPKFPVYKTYRLLKSKFTQNKQFLQGSDPEVLAKCSYPLQEILCDAMEEPATKMWAEKYRPNCASDIIGNFEGVHTLKQWLITWKENNNDGKSQPMRRKSDSSDSSDFYYPSDTDSCDIIKSYNNVLVVTGPVGCGKTSAIYAVAAELSLKVIEVNASAKRTGKTILSNLQEATQSHKINSKVSSSENSQNSQESSKQHKNKKSKPLLTYSKKCIPTDTMEKCNEEISISQASKGDYSKTSMSLILVEDADLVFEQDDGFISALNQIVQISKRPVIIVTSSLTCLHLQRFIRNGNVIKFHHLSPKMLGTWLDILCLVENADIWPNMGQQLLDFCKGDMRKAMNSLQFWTASEHKNGVSNECEKREDPSEPDGEKFVMDDECSSISWTDHEQNSNKEIDLNAELKKEAANLTKTLFKTFVSFNDHDIGVNSSILQFPVDHLNIWWNIPSLFGFDEVETVPMGKLSTIAQDNEKGLLALSNVIDSISASDLIYAKMTQTIDTSVISSPWTKRLCDSVSEIIDTSTYKRSKSLGDSMSYALITSSLCAASKKLGTTKDVDYTLPGMAQIRCRERIITRHKGLYDGLPLSSLLDRRSLAMDYLSTCREICRIEKGKSENNLKRNNRFCHYLKSLRVTCSSDVLELLCESLDSDSRVIGE